MGKLILANSSAYDNSAFSAELTGYAAGFSVPSVEEILEFIAPCVKVPSHRFEYRKYGKGQFAIDVSDERSVYGEFKMISNPQEIIQDKLIHRGLTYIMDDDEIAAGEENKIVENVKKLLLRNELYRASSLLETVATSTTKKWTTATGKSMPDSDLRKMLFSTVKESGLRANRVLFGGEALQLRFEAYENSTMDGSNVAANLSLEQLALKVRAQKVMVSEDIYEGVSPTDGTDKKFALIQENKVYAFHGQKGVSKEDPSTFKRFVAKDGFKVFVEQKAAGKLITVSHYSKLAQTGAGCAVALSISNS